MVLSATLAVLSVSTPGVEVASLAGGQIQGNQGALIRQAGSIAKYVCAMTALKMENEGLLSLDAPVHVLLPGYEGSHDDALTLRRLLENRSGLEDQVIEALISDPELPDRSIPALEARPIDLLAISAYPFTSDDFDADDRAALTHVTSPAHVYTLGGRFETVINADGERRQISWRNDNNDPWFAVALYDSVTGEGMAVMSSEGGDEALAMRDAWLEERGWVRAPRPDE